MDLSLRLRVEEQQCLEAVPQVLREHAELLIELGVAFALHCTKGRHAVLHYEPFFLCFLWGVQVIYSITSLGPFTRQITSVRP